MLPVINPLVIETFARLHAAMAFLGTLNEGIPIVEEREDSYLDQLAKQGGWEYEEYYSEKLVLNEKFHNWIPTLAAYSAITLLHSIVETQLHGFAEHIGDKRGVRLRVKDMAGKGVEQSALYLQRVLSVDVKADPSWCGLQDMGSLRNIIVHRGGKPGESGEQKRTVYQLIKKYPQAIEIRKAFGSQGQVWIGMSLCRDFAAQIDGFFERVFRATGLPNRHMMLDT